MEETSNNGMSTWGALVGVVGGAALGYWAGRSNDNNYFNNGCGYNNTICGSGGYNAFEAGKTQAEVTAGLTYTSGGIQAVRQDLGALASQMYAGFQRQDERQFQMLVAENQALKSDLSLNSSLCPIRTELAGINYALSCLKNNQVSAFKSVPLCTTCPTATTTA